MAVHCTDAKGLGKSIKSGENTIIVEGNLAKKVIIIKATGPVAWGVCAAALAVAIAIIISTPEQAEVAAVTGGATAVPSAVFSVVGETAAGAVATATLGTSAVPAIIIGVAAGGVGALTTLRDKYKIVEKTGSYIKLQKK